MCLAGDGVIPLPAGQGGTNEQEDREHREGGTPG